MSTEIIGVKFNPLVRPSADLMVIFGKDLGKARECGEMEMDALECMEAYGVRRGYKLCHSYIEDFRECLKQFIQTKRVAEMKRERVKQVLRGERKFLEVYDDIKPPRDSFQYGPFYN